MAIEVWQYHFILNLIGFILLVAGIVSVIYLRGKKVWFYTSHKIMMTTGVILLVVGVLVTGLNINFLHAYLGIVIFLGSIFSLIGGWLHNFWRPREKKLRKQRKKMRQAHIVLGYIFAVGTLFALLKLMDFL